MVVIVTGGGGDLGRQVLREVLARNEKPVAFDVAPRTAGLEDVKDSIDFVKGNVLNMADVLDVIQKYEADRVVHLAALLTADAAVRPFETLQVNTMGTATVLEACRIAGVKRIIYASTSSVYGPSPPTVMVNEDYAKKPWNVYGASKYASELYGQIYCKKYGMEFSAIRLKILLAPGQRRDTGAMIVFHDALAKVLREENASLPYFPDDTLHITYVKDAARAFALACFAQKLHPAYNVLTGVYTLKDIASSIEKAVGGSGRISFESKKRLDTVIASSGPYDISLAEKELGYRSVYNLDNMFREIVEYERSGIAGALV